MDINSAKFLSIEQLKDQYLNTAKSTESAKTQDGLTFKDILSEKTSDADVRFSKHAASRLATRNIELTDEQLGRLNEGAKKAQDKGIRESLVLVDSLAFIVNVPNSTVVTAMQQGEANDNIFTNIDGAVIA